MTTIQPLLLGLGLLLPAAGSPVHLPTDPARLREMLQDRQHPRSQSQAALLLVQSTSPDAEEVVREGLRQIDSPEIFLALAGAVRLQRDTRFVDELLAALQSGQPALLQGAALTLAELADATVVLRLQALSEDPKADRTARIAALGVLGQSGSKSAVVVLLDQLSSDEELIRQAAADALASLTGQAYGTNVAKWRDWWERHREQETSQWLEERLLYQASRSRRLEGDLERAKAQIVRLHQQLYSRLPVADRLGHVQSLVDHEDPAVRALAVGWGTELLGSADAVGQRALTDVLLRLSRDGNLEVQRTAVLALGRVHDVRAYDRLRVLVTKGRAPVRAAAARALPQQARGSGPDALARQRQVVPALQKALDDASLEVVIEAAEGLGSLGIPEAGPVLTVLLRHPSGPVRQAAAQALERIADPAVLDGLLEALDDPVVTVRFSLIGAIGHAASDGQGLTDAQRNRLIGRLEAALIRDSDPGVRSRAASVLGQCGQPSSLALLWRRVTAAEESRVQEKVWAAFVEILIRAAQPELLYEWDRTLVEAKQPARRLQLLSEVHAGWQKNEETKALASAIADQLVQAQLEQGKWPAVLPVVREMLSRPANDTVVEQRLRWLLAAGEQALKEGNRAEALRVVQDANPFLPKRANLAPGFDKLEAEAKKEP